MAGDSTFLVGQQKVAAFVARISGRQSTVRELNQEINRLKQGAKINGVDLESLAFVRSIRSQFPPDNGVKTIDCADRTGVVIGHNPSRVADELQLSIDVASTGDAHDFESWNPMRKRDNRERFRAPGAGQACDAPLPAVARRLR